MERKFTNIEDVLKFNALTNGKYFSFVKNPKLEKENIKNYCGFKLDIVRRNNVVCKIIDDPRAVISLSLLRKQNTIIPEYINKLPIICINVSRLKYTIAAFRFVNDNENVENDALTFLLRVDLRQRNINDPPNLQFSKILHLFRSNGYEEYMFELARCLNLNVDLLGASNIVYRYTRVDLEKNIRPPIGYLTIKYDHDGQQWFVSLTKSPIAVS